MECAKHYLSFQEENSQQDFVITLIFEQLCNCYVCYLQTLIETSTIFLFYVTHVSKVCLLLTLINAHFPSLQQWFSSFSKRNAESESSLFVGPIKCRKALIKIVYFFLAIRLRASFNVRRNFKPSIILKHTIG